MSNRETDPRHHPISPVPDGAKLFIPMMGSEFCFSNDLLKTLAAEFDSVTFTRAADLAEVVRIRESRGHVPLLLVDEAFISTQADMLAAAQAAGTDMLVLAYGGHPPDHNLLRQGLNDHDPPRLGLLPLNVRIDVLLAMVRLLLCGEILVPETILRSLLTAQHVAPPRIEPIDPAIRDLTRREWEVLALIAKGKQNKIVAAELGLSEHTVKLHIHHLISKLGVSNRTSAAIWFLAQGEAAMLPTDVT